MKKIKILSIISIIVIGLLSIVSFASVLFRSFVESEATVTANTVDDIVNINEADKSPIKVSSSVQTFTFEKAGDYKELTIQVNNNTASVVDYQYEFAFDGNTFTRQDESFASAILVYFNGEFIDTLGNICANENSRVEKGFLDFKGHINKASDSTTSVTDKLKFELHSSADGSYFDNDASMSFNLRVYANTADYEHNMFVTSEAELIRAFSDLNYGTLPLDTKIILLNNIILSQNFELNYPVEIDLNGYKLDVNSTLTFKGEGTSIISSTRNMSISSLSSSGSIVVNNSKAILDIKDFYNVSGANIGYLYSNITTATSYKAADVKELVISRIKNNVRYGIASGASINLCGALTFYNLDVTTSSNLSYSNPNITASSTDYNVEESVTIDSDTKIGVKVIASESNDAILTSILNNELKHLVKLSEEDETTHELINTNAADLFLPTSIKSKNATIEWVSSDESLISNTGIISANISGNAILTIYAHININDEVYTKAFKVKTMSQNHETIFQYFVAQLSPIEMEYVFTGSNIGSAYYFLPIVDEDYNPVDNSSYDGYDYRSSYTTPEEVTPGYSWEGFNNVGFEYINYSPISTYNFISIDQNAKYGTKTTGVAVYLNSATFQTFAQVQATAKFNGDEQIYSAPVNLIIKLGYNTKLNELVFNKVSEDLNEINVLQNILDTRKENGMKLENGDFYLDGSYQTYLISYTIPESSKDAIKKIEGYAVDDNGDITGDPIATITYGQSFDSDDVKEIGKYKVYLNIEGFDTSDSNFGITTILSMPGVTETASRILYFKCPGVIKNDSTGFSNMSVFNSVKYQVYKELCSISSEKGDDDVRDEDYTTSAKNATSFVESGSLVTNYTGAYILRHDANLCTTLAFSLAESNTNTDNHIVYGLAKLIDWAVGTDSTTTFSTYFNNILDSSFISGNLSFGNYMADGTENITTQEKAVIQKYYTSKTNISDSEFASIWESVTNQENEYIIYNSSTLYSDLTSITSFSKNGSSSGKYQEIYEWAHNDKDFANEGYDGNPPNYGVIGTYNWGLTKENIEQFATGTLSLSAVSISPWSSSYYFVNEYKENESYTFSKEEMCVYLVFILNSTISSGGSNTTIVNSVRNFFINHFTLPTFFITSGISDLINQMYLDLNLSVSNTSTNANGFKSEITAFSVMGTNYYTPHVTNFDFSTLGFDYFPNLKTLYIKGDKDGKLKAFENAQALSNFFNRITSNNSLIENLACEYCSNENMEFSLKTIYNLKNLKKLSLYHNLGIDNIGALLKLNIEKLTYVDVADINIKFDYYEFVLQAINLKATNPTIFYQPDNSTSHSTYTISLNSDAEGLIYLEEFYELLAENTNMTNNVYTSDGSQSIQWKIEEGNGITLVTNTYTNGQMYDLAYKLDPILIKYYLVTTEFSYGGYNFQANHLYWVYDDGNGNIIFEAVKDESDNEIIVTIGTAPSNLTEAQVNEYIADNKITGSNESFSNSNVHYSDFSNISNSYKKIFESTDTLVIYDANGNQIGSLNNVYRLGYNDTRATRTVTTTTYNYTSSDPAYAFEATLYYASLSNGTYTITKNVYEVSKHGNVSYTSSILTQTESVKNIVYSNYRTGLFRYTYTYYSLLANYPNASSFKYNGTTYNIKTYTTFSYSINTGTSTSGESGTQSGATNTSRTSSIDYYTAIPFTKAIYQKIETALERKYVAINSEAFTWYDAGIQKTQAKLDYGGHTISLNTKSNGGGFTYSSVLSENGAEAQAYKATLTMKDILAEANTHLTDSMFGLYYHNYYAFPGTTNISYKYGDFIADFRAYGIYYLEIENDGKFYWAQSSNENEKYYTIMTGTYQTLFNSVGSLTSSDAGKIIYYTGSTSSGDTVGTNFFLQVLYNPESGSYYYKRFGVLGKNYILCDGAGDFNNSWANSTYGTPSGNSGTKGLNVLCNLMLYLDSNFFVNNSATTNFTYGVGGTRQAVFTAMITVNGVKYERKFVIKVSS